MGTTGQPECSPQNRVITLFRDERHTITLKTGATTKATATSMKVFSLPI